MFNGIPATIPKLVKRKPQVKHLRFSLFWLYGWPLRLKHSRCAGFVAGGVFRLPSYLLHDLIRLDELLIVADMLACILNFGQQEVVDDLDDHRGTDF